MSTQSIFDEQNKVQNHLQIGVLRAEPSFPADLPMWLSGQHAGVVECVIASGSTAAATGLRAC